MQDEPLRIVPRSDGFHGIVGHLVRKWDFGENPPVRAAEPKLAVRLSIERVALLMDGAVMPATEQREVRERGRAALRPVADVMPLAEPHATAREAAAAVSVVECPP
jgi:hypothetical protein